MKIKSILSVLVLLSASLLFSQAVFADDAEVKVEKVAKEKKVKKAKVALEDMTHTGVVEEKKNKTRNTYYLKTAAGKIRLPVSPKKSKNPIALVTFVGKNVTVTGKGFIKVKTTKKGEVKKVVFKKLTSVKEVAAVEEAKKEEAKKEEVKK